jgi:hypothetical protein
MGTTDNEIRLWLLQFAACLMADHGKYFVSEADAITVNAAVQAYDVAYGLANTEETRTKAVVNAKDVSRNSAMKICQVFAGLIKGNVGISDEDKILAGVPLINPNREQRNCPQSALTVSVAAATQGAHTLNYINTLDTTKKAKPFGATEVELFVHIGATAISSATEARFYRKFTTNPMLVVFEPEDNGKIASYFARWAGRRGDTGPYSAGVSMPIAA